ncbi:gp436 family protein [Eikenella corrodens]|jgi:putative prophage protein gp36|uniref:gp436 family protein n=1 Tax=Eikenella corrodens TaxID=539 RepID=UPI000AFCC29D|nr:DUF1320 domain-containing protein [Eikenella corrodens]DAQ73707.1 MAG TPA: head to tail adaptor [Caudoviricetes sp.]
MSSIITRQDLIDRFGEDELVVLTDREGRGVIDDEVLNRAIEDAEAETAAYIQAAGLVLPSPPKVLVIKVCDIARYYLHDNGETQVVLDRYKQAIAWLRDVVRNPRLLDPDAVVADAKPSACAVRPNVPEDNWEIAPRCR